MRLTLFLQEVCTKTGRLLLAATIVITIFSTAHPASGSRATLDLQRDIVLRFPSKLSSQLATGRLYYRIPISTRPNRVGLTAIGQLNFYPNIETLGVTVSGDNLPPRAELMYRRSGESAWRPGHPLVRIDDGRLVGSLFGLLPAASYDLKVVNGTSEGSGSVTTQPDQLQFTPTTILYVDDDAPPGGDGSASAPLQTIQQGVSRAGPGTQVLVADGVYHETITFPASGTPANWIQVKAAGSNAILDGSQELTGNVWTRYRPGSNIWFTRITSTIRYLSRDEERFYLYDDRNGLMQGRGHNRVPMNEGWYYESGTRRLYVRSLDPPSNYTWQLPRLNHAFYVDGRDWLWIEGFEMRFYGAGANGCGVCTLNASHIVIRRNKIHNMQLGVFINWTSGGDRGNDTRVEYNEIYDPTAGEWPWRAVKGTSMEGTGIIVRGHIGAIVRGNQVHHFFNGIYTGSSGALENPEVAFDADIYNNFMHDISDDGLEPEGACVNHRFRNNVIDTMLVGISLAPVTQGPTWVLRSLFTDFTGTSIKWDRNSDGQVFIYHNTAWTNTNSLSAMQLISPVHNAILRNNIFRSNEYTFEENPTGSTGNDWNYNNWHTTRGPGLPHFKWEDEDYYSIAALCAATGLECDGHEDMPGLNDPLIGDFTLIPTSTNIDWSLAIPGINDEFSGAAPDLGAYEFTNDSPLVIVSSTPADANPTSAPSVNFTVTFSAPVTGVDMVPPYDDFALTISPEIVGASITSVAPLSETTYVVTVHTGSGNGIVRLDIIDDDSIFDSGGRALGGWGIGNGSFSAGEVYVVNKPAP